MNEILAVTEFLKDDMAEKVKGCIGDVIGIETCRPYYGKGQSRLRDRGVF